MPGITKHFERVDQKLLSSPWGCIAFVWGFAEAILFFIVPDVWLSVVARNKLTLAVFKALGRAIAGAVIGSVIMYGIGRFHPEKANVFLDGVPGINPGMLDKARRQMSESGLLALMIGPLQGIPYKIYTARWGMNHGNLLLMGLVSVPIRGLRFLLTVLLTRWVCSLAERRIKIWNKISLMVLAIFWTVFYVCYFFHFGW